MLTRHTGLIASLAVVAVSGSAGAAETKVRVRTNLGLTASTNPLLSTADSVSAMLAELSVEPTLSSTTETSSIAVTGRLARREYFRRYEPATYGNVAITATKQQSERIQLSGGLSYSRDIATDVVDDIAAALDPASVRTQLTANGAANITLSERSSLSPNVTFSRQRFRRSGVLLGSDSYSVGTGYSRLINEQLSLGLRADAAVQRYQGLGNSHVISLLGTANYRLDEFTTLNGGIGVERATIGDLDISGRGPATETFLGGNVSACRRGGRLTLCARAAVSSAAAGFGGLQRRASAGLTANMQVDRDTSVSLVGDVQRSSPIGDFDFPSLRYATVRGNIERKLGNQLAIGGRAEYRSRSGFGSARSFAIGTDLRWQWGQD